MFSPSALEQVFELLQMRTQSNLPYCPQESWSWISSASLCWSSNHHLPFGMLCTGCWHGVWRLTALLFAKIQGALQSQNKLWNCIPWGNTLTTCSPNLLQKRPTLTIHLKVSDSFCVGCNWIETCTSWATWFGQETVVWEEARLPSSGTTQNGRNNRWKILFTPNFYLWKLHFNYIPRWQKTRPLLYLWYTFYSNLLLIDAISLCEQKLRFVFFFSCTIFRTKALSLGSHHWIKSYLGKNKKKPTKNPNQQTTAPPPRFWSTIFQQEGENRNAKGNLGC